MSTNVGIVVLLCLCLIFAMIRYRSSRAAGADGEATTPGKRTLKRPAIRLRRAITRAPSRKLRASAATVHGSA